jgi:phage shock protein A
MKVPFGKTRSPGVLPGLDHAYKQQLAALSKVRRAVATAATRRKQLELQLDQMAEKEASDHGYLHRPDSDSRLEALRDQYAAAQEKEQRFIEASRRLQRKIDAFRVAKEATEAAFATAQDALHSTQAEISDHA